MLLSAAYLVHSAFLTQAKFHAETLTLLLGYTIDALQRAPAEGRDRATLNDIAIELGQLRRQATIEKWDFTCLGALKTTVLTARFVRLGDDLPNTDNPLFNITIWLADAIGHAGALARLRITCESTATISEAT